MLGILAATSHNNVGWVTMDVDYGEGTKGHPGTPRQLPTYQFHNVSDLVVALPHIVLMWRREKIREDLVWKTHHGRVTAQTLTGRVLVTMASDTSVVQKMEEAQMTTWPGHCSTHFFLGSCKRGDTS